MVLTVDLSEADRIGFARPAHAVRLAPTAIGLVTGSAGAVAESLGRAGSKREKFLCREGGLGHGR
jgi:hypothetical protein